MHSVAIRKAQSMMLGSCLAAVFSLYTAFSQTPEPPPTFERFHVDLYRGATRKVHGFRRESDGEWLDDAGKPASAPHISFAGEYFLTAHSCGTSCRYYSMGSLRTGHDVSSISMFSAGEPTPRTKDGHEYIPILYFRPNSKLLIVQYLLDPNSPEDKESCRQRYYVFESGNFHAISKTLPACTNEGDEPR